MDGAAGAGFLSRRVTPSSKLRIASVSAQSAKRFEFGFALVMSPDPWSLARRRPQKRCGNGTMARAPDSVVASMARTMDFGNRAVAKW
jgi:hypothetical protein